jgi:hypothetical protein
MAKVVETDEQVKLSEQLDEDVGPFILINMFNVKPKEADQFLKAWEKDATYFKSQPGFISTQLHQGIGGSGVFVNYAVWEFTALFKMALSKIDYKISISHNYTRFILSLYVVMLQVCIEII